MDDEISSIPNIPGEIIMAAQRGKLVIFVGAGVSKLLGCPDWKEFALRHLRYLYEKKKINFFEFERFKSLDARKLLSICWNIYKEEKLQPPNMKELLKTHNEKHITIYNDLYSFNAIYVTTNYDDYLDEEAQKSKRQISSKDISPQDTTEDLSKKPEIIYSKDDLLISKLEIGNVIHLHGSIRDEKNTVITIVDYINHYEHGTKPSVFLEEIFKSYTVLFIGYGLEEYEILEFLISKSRTPVGEIRHFMLYPIFKQESNLLRFYEGYYRDLGVQLIPYMIDDNGYDQLITIIHKWSKIIGPISKPKNHYERIKLIDEVIK